MNNNKKSWFSKPVQCIILCAGAGMRMKPVSLQCPKVLTKVNNKPLLDYVIEFWSEYTSEFILVVGTMREMVYEYAEKRGLNCRFVVQEEQRGIAHALSLCESIAGERFILQLGDCLTKGDFIFPENMKQGVGVWKTTREEDTLRSYSVELDTDKILHVEEKPEKAPNDLCGMGTYFLDKSVFDMIRRTPPSPLRGEQEITDVLANLIKEYGFISPVIFDGDYINVTYPEDIERVAGIFER